MAAGNRMEPTPRKKRAPTPVKRDPAASHPSQSSDDARIWMAAIVDGSDDAIIGKDLEGVITSWNRGAEMTFGYTAAEAIGQSITLIIPPERAQEEADMIVRIRRGEKIQHFETVRVTKSGQRIEVSATISPVRDASGKIIGASKIIRDITAQKRNAQILAASEQQYRLIFEESPLPKWIYDLNTLRILAANRAAQKHYGYTKEEFLQLTLRDIRPPEDLPALQKDVATARGAGSRSSEWRHRKKDGTLIDVLISSHDVKMDGVDTRLVVAQDITERKQSEARVQAQLARLQLLHQITRAIGERQDLRSIFQVVVRSVEDSLLLDFCCLSLYDAADQVLTVTCIGARSEAVATALGLEISSRIPLDENGIARCVRGHLVHEPDIANAKFPFPRQLAAAGLRSLVFAPLVVESKVFGVLIAARRAAHTFSSGECEFLKQLSEHTALAANHAEVYQALQHAYDDLRQTQQVVLQQERLRALGQMASGIAHDINNAISPAALYTESILEQEPNLSERARERLTVVQRALDDVAQTVARMREFYRQRESQLELSPVDLNRLVPHVVELSRARWNDMPQQRGAVIDVRSELAPDLPPIMGVESEVREALVNLVFNAIDAMPDGGTLTLRTRVLKEPSPTRVIIEVVDTGQGMSPDTRRRCLEPFFTTKGERGTGLGLAMVYGIMQRHSAEIEIDSTPGRGTTMRLVFTLPEVSAAAKPATKPAGRARRMRLLLVDDDPMLIKSLSDTLEGDGHVIVTANGGRAGIDTFLASLGKEPFAAVITDLGMPYVDGRKVAHEIKVASPNTPVIMLTGWGQRLEVEGDVPPDVDYLLAKPPKLRELRETLARVSEKLG